MAVVIGVTGRSASRSPPQAEQRSRPARSIDRPQRRRRSARLDLRCRARPVAAPLAPHDHPDLRGERLAQGHRCRLALTALLPHDRTMPLALSDAERATRALVKVAGTCRGFVVANPGGRRFVLTAAHCLPLIPFLDLKLKTFDRLVTSGRRRVTERCHFVDPWLILRCCRQPWFPRV